MAKKYFFLFLISAAIVITVFNINLLRPLGRFFIDICGFKAGGDLFIDNLKMENAVLKNQLEELKDVKKENDFLRNFLGLDRPVGFKYVLAEVVVRSPFNFSQSFTVNQGSAGGLKEGDVVAWTGKILLGKITKVFENYALAQTLFDESVKIDVLIGEKSLGLLKGEHSRLIIESIPKNDKINIGDSVAVSALGGQYLKGLVIGEIEKIIDEPQELFKKAEVKVPYNWMDVERVMVITK